MCNVCEKSCLTVFLWFVPVCHLLSGTLSSPIPTLLFRFFSLPLLFHAVSFKLTCLLLRLTGSWLVTFLLSPYTFSNAYDPSISSSPCLLSPDPPYILAVFPMFSSPSFHRYPAPSFLFVPRFRLNLPFAYFTILVFFCIHLSNFLSFPVERVFLFLTRIHSPPQLFDWHGFTGRIHV